MILACIFGGVILLLFSYCVWEIGYSSGMLRSQIDNIEQINFLTKQYEAEHKRFIELRNSKNYAEWYEKYQKSFNSALQQQAQNSYRYSNIPNGNPPHGCQIFGGIL